MRRPPGVPLKRQTTATLRRRRRVCRANYLACIEEAQASGYDEVDDEDDPRDYLALVEEVLFYRSRHGRNGRWQP